MNWVRCNRRNDDEPEHAVPTKRFDSDGKSFNVQSGFAKSPIYFANIYVSPFPRYLYVLMVFISTLIREDETFRKSPICSKAQIDEYRGGFYGVAIVFQ